MDRMLSKHKVRFILWKIENGINLERSQGI